MTDILIADDDEGVPPGDDKTATYSATNFVRTGGKAGGGFLWFSCKDASRDRVLQLGNLYEMEPSFAEGKAVLHFTGMDVLLTGSGLRRVAHQIFLGRCTRISEIRDDQKPEKPDDPIVKRIEFLVPPPEQDGD